MRNTVHLGDCLDIMQQIPSGSLDMILCDLPYGTTACKWDTVIPFAPLWEQYERVIKENGAIVLTASQPFTSLLIMSNAKRFKYELIWDKNYGSAPGVAKYRPMPSHESVLVFGNGRITYNPQMLIGKPYIDKRAFKPVDKSHINGNEHGFGFKQHVGAVNEGTRFPRSVITIQRFNTPGQHPTQKPVPLFEYLIKTYTNPGDVVLDNCAGSGTTAIACMNTGRGYILIEKEPKYYDIIIDRIAKAKEKQASQLFV